jgi:hypothetical protein
MIFKSYSESAQLLAARIAEEGIANPIFTFINPDAANYCHLVSPQAVIFDQLQLSPSPSTLVILDDGSTPAAEYNEFTDRIRKNYPETYIVIAIPVIPESEKTTLESAGDSLLYLHADPLFFSINQFYQEN